MREVNERGCRTCGLWENIEMVSWLSSHADSLAWWSSNMRSYPGAHFPQEQTNSIHDLIPNTVVIGPLM